MSMFSRAFHRVTSTLQNNPVAALVAGAPTIPSGGASGGNILGMIGTAVGTAFGGPVGGELGGALGGLVGQRLVDPADGGSDVPQIPGPIAAAGGSAAAGGTATAIMGAATAAGGLLKNAAGKVVGFILKDGSHLSLAGAAQLVMRFGPTVLASAIGIGVEQLISAIFGHKHLKRRRHRGITAADMRRTRSTIRKVTRLHSQLAHLARSSIHHSARRGFGGGRSVQVVRAG